MMAGLSQRALRRTGAVHTTNGDRLAEVRSQRETDACGGGG